MAWKAQVGMYLLYKTSLTLQLPLPRLHKVPPQPKSQALNMDMDHQAPASKAPTPDTSLKKGRMEGCRSVPLRHRLYGPKSRLGPTDITVRMASIRQ